MDGWNVALGFTKEKEAGPSTGRGGAQRAMAAVNADVQGSSSSSEDDDEEGGERGESDGVDE